MLFVLHGCKDSNPKIQLFVNEGLVKMPWCSGTMCPLSEFEDYMRSLCDECTHAAWHSTCTQIRYTAIPSTRYAHQSTVNCTDDSGGLTMFMFRPEHHGEVGIVLLPGGATIPLTLAVCLVIYLMVIHWRSKQR